MDSRLKIRSVAELESSLAKADTPARDDSPGPERSEPRYLVGGQNLGVATLVVALLHLADPACKPERLGIRVGGVAAVLLGFPVLGTFDLDAVERTDGGLHIGVQVHDLKGVTTIFGRARRRLVGARLDAHVFGCLLVTDGLV